MRVEMIRRPLLATVAAIGACAALLASVASAGAFEGRPTIGTPFGSISYGTGIAVDQSNGNVFVADDNTNQIFVFGPNGEAPIGGGPSNFGGAGSHDKEFTFYYKAGISFDSKNHVLYIPNTGTGSVDKYKFEGGEWKYQCEFLGAGEAGNMCTATGIEGAERFKETLGTAVDSAGDLYVVQWNFQKIFEYNPGGEQVGAFAMPSLPEYVVVGATGTLYMVPWYNGPVSEFTRSSLTGAIEGDPEGTQIGTEGVSGIAYNESNGDLILDHGGFVEELNSKNELVSDTVSGELSNSAEGAAVNETTNHLYANNTAAKTVVQFGTKALLPDATTNTPSPVERASATLKGTVNPHGVAGTKYWFEYGPQPPYEETTPKIEIEGEPEEAIVVSAAIGSLKSASTYHYRLVTENPAGVNPGEDIEFNTAVAVEGMKNLEATGVGVETATFHGMLEPNGVATTCWFKYGTEFYNLTQQTPHESAGSESRGVEFSQMLTNLEPVTVYYYSLACSNSYGESEASEPAFRIAVQTLPTAPVVYSESAASSSRDEIVLQAEINPANSLTTYYFEYGETNQYGYRTPVTALSTTRAGHQLAEALASELKPDTTYHFRVVTENPVGTATGADSQFKSGSLTPPIATTGDAAKITPSEGTITGVVNTKGLLTIYGFQLGTSEGDLGPTTGEGSVGAGFSEGTVALELHNLQPSATYYYRVVARSVDGESIGATRSFTTSAYPNPNITVQQLRVLTEPFVAWPTSNTGIFPTGVKPPTSKCKKGHVERNGRCVKKKVRAKGKAKRRSTAKKHKG